MESRVDDFLNEINEIAPSKQKKQECVWQECYDETTGFAYYWNTQTDEVTWEEPKEFKKYKESISAKKLSQKYSLYVPPKTPASPRPDIKEAIKIYKLGEISQKSNTGVSVNKTEQTSQKNDEKYENRKIQLIASYDSGTESENEDQAKNSNEIDGESAKLKLFDFDRDKSTVVSESYKTLEAPKSSVIPNPLLLTGIQNNESIKESTKKEIAPTKSSVNHPPRTDVSAFLLVASYGNSDEEQENTENVTSPIKPLFPVVHPQTTANKISHSTLFPVTKAIDIKDLDQSSEPSKLEKPVPLDDFNSRAFQRKRRIGVDLINVKKRPALETTTTEEPEKEQETDRKGFGYGSEKGSMYPGFKSGGVMFVKSDVLNPSFPVNKIEFPQKVEMEVSNVESKISRDKIEDTYTTLKEKLGFLSEGRQPILPVQEMIIQIETLFNAMKEGALKLSYLHKWLTETSTELIKLEKEATPEGWLLQWDRSHKRYYYQNEHTGESQWEYPQPDIVRCDEAMDISTTPPPCPVEQEIRMSPPLPPQISSPSPPPPPIISTTEDEEQASESPLPSVINVPLPPPSLSEISDGGEPLPPGVDLQEVTPLPPTKVNDVDPNLSSALDSFYCDIAAIECTNSSVVPIPVTETLPPPPVEISSPPKEQQIPITKKKKKKVKLAEGLSMKKKGVSQLVEKWKNVKYND